MSSKTTPSGDGRLKNRNKQDNNNNNSGGNDDDNDKNHHRHLHKNEEDIVSISKRNDTKEELELLDDDQNEETSSSKNNNNNYGYVCIYCGYPSSTLYRQLSKVSLSSIQVTSCTNCQQIVDPYCERELLLVVIDCILLREEAYRHVLYNNMDDDELKRLMTSNPLRFIQFGIVVSLLDVYLKWETLVLQQQTISSSTTTTTTIGLLFFLGISSIIGILLQCMIIVSLINIQQIPSSSSSSSMNNKLIIRQVMLALLLPSSFTFVTIIVMMWENTRTIQTLGSILITYWQCIGISVLSSSSTSTTSIRGKNDKNNGNNTMYSYFVTPIIGIIITGTIWRFIVATIWMTTTVLFDNHPHDHHHHHVDYPCIGIELSLPNNILLFTDEGNNYFFSHLGMQFPSSICVT